MTTNALASGSDRRSLDSIRTWWVRLPWWGQCTALWAIMVIGLSVVGLITASSLGLSEGILALVNMVGLDPSITPRSLPGMWARYDSGWYLIIALEGYATHLKAVGFFPLYPMFTSGLSQVTGWNIVLTGMLVAQGSFLASILALYKVAYQFRAEHGYAMRAVLHLILFPTSLFLLSLYAEPLFLAFALVGAYFALRQQPSYVLAGLMFGLASAARPVGFLLNIILVVEFIRRRDFSFYTLFSMAAGLFLSASGVIGYVLYLYSITGSLTAITDAQGAGWSLGWRLPFMNILAGIQNILRLDFLRSDWFGYVVNANDTLFAVGAVGLAGLALWWAYKGKFAWSLALFMCGYLAFVMSVHKVWVPLNSFIREILPLFPIYLILATLSSRSRRFQIVSLTFSGAMLVVLTVWWASGRYVG